MGRLGSGPRVVGRLGSRVRVSASFQMFALTAGRDVLGGEGNCPAGEMSCIGLLRFSRHDGFFVTADLCDSGSEQIRYATYF